MTAIEMKYSLFRDIDSISDESVLMKLSAFVKSMLIMPQVKSTIKKEAEDIPDFIRNMSVKANIPDNMSVKDLIHQHWDDTYGKGLSKISNTMLRTS